MPSRSTSQNAPARTATTSLQLISSLRVGRIAAQVAVKRSGPRTHALEADAAQRSAKRRGRRGSWYCDGIARARCRRCRTSKAGSEPQRHRGRAPTAANARRARPRSPDGSSPTGRAAPPSLALAPPSDPLQALFSLVVAPSCAEPTRSPPDQGRPLSGGSVRARERRRSDGS